jgi:hypothetical protein
LRSFLAEISFTGRGLADLASAVAGSLAESPQLGAAELRERLEREGHAERIAAVLETLRRSGLGTLAGGNAEDAAAAWDDAAHLRLRTGTLSIERQAAAAALLREAGEVNLSRLRDIQEQDQRSLRPDQREDLEATAIVHPFRRG